MTIFRPLEALNLALGDVLVAGSHHPLLEPQNGHAGGRTTSPAQAMLRGQAVGFVEILCTGHSESDAVQHVADRLNAVGVKGQKGGGITKSTVRSWRTSANSGSYPDLRQIADEVLLTAKTASAELSQDWPPSPAFARTLVDALSASLSFKDLIESANTIPIR